MAREPVMTIVDVMPEIYQLPVRLHLRKEGRRLIGDEVWHETFAVRAKHTRVKSLINFGTVDSREEVSANGSRNLASGDALHRHMLSSTDLLAETALDWLPQQSRYEPVA